MSAYKIEVPDLHDEEVNRLAIAYAAMRGLPPRCMRWLTLRLRNDDLDAWVTKKEQKSDQK